MEIEDLDPTNLTVTFSNGQVLSLEQFPEGLRTEGFFESLRTSFTADLLGCEGGNVRFA
jgi:hypothetical protein